MEKPPAPKPVTARWLMNAAQFYLARYAASEAGLTAVLRRKATKRAGAPPDAAAALALIAETVATLQQAGLIDDRAFAAARTRTLQRKGLSAGSARQRLAAKGVDREVADAAIAEAGFDETAQVLAAARRLRIAAFSDPTAVLSDRDKARLARRGFGPGAIRAALQASREGGRQLGEPAPFSKPSSARRRHRVSSSTATTASPKASPIQIPTPPRPA